jgi:hypothetical protein
MEKEQTSAGRKTTEKTNRHAKSADWRSNYSSAFFTAFARLFHLWKTACPNFRQR